MRVAPYMFMGPMAAGVRRGPLLKVTIFEFQRGLLYRRGRFARVLEPGVYWLRARDTFVRLADARPVLVTIPGQEVLTADGVTIKVSMAARYEIADLDVAFNKVVDTVGEFYAVLQLALRTIVGAIKIDELLEARDAIGARLVELAAGPVSDLGLRLLGAGVKDVMFPGELKKIFAQVAEARQEGLAALEKARGETAALRNLANAARMVESNPALLQLRTLQAVAAQPGSTIVLGAPGIVPAAKPAAAKRRRRPKNDDE